MAGGLAWARAEFELQGILEALEVIEDNNYPQRL